jgi:hypothetical protein
MIVQEKIMMTDQLKRYATPFITGLFLVSLVSGIALFFHLGGSTFRGMHEWLSMVLVVPFVLHIWRNWRAMIGYLNRPAFSLAMAVSLVAAIAFAYPSLTGASGGAGGPPPFAFSDMALSHPAKDVAPLLGLSPDAVVAELQKLGYAAAAVDVPLADAAHKAGKSDMELIAALMQIDQKP